MPSLLVFLKMGLAHYLPKSWSLLSLSFFPCFAFSLAGPASISSPACLSRANLQPPSRLLLLPHDLEEPEKKGQIRAPGGCSSSPSSMNAVAVSSSLSSPFIESSSPSSRQWLWKIEDRGARREVTKVEEQSTEKMKAVRVATRDSFRFQFFQLHINF